MRVLISEMFVQGKLKAYSLCTAARRFVFECRVASGIKQPTCGSPSVCASVLCLFTASCANAILDPALRRSEASLQLMLPVLRIAKGNFNEGIVLKVKADSIAAR